MFALFGFKQNDGYSWTRATAPKPLPGCYLNYGAAAITAHKCGTHQAAGEEPGDAWAKAVGYKIINPKDLKFTSKYLRIGQECLFDPVTTLKIVIMVHQQTKEVVIAFGASNSFETEASSSEEQRVFKKRQLIQIGKNLLGCMPSLYALAEKTMGVIQPLLKDQYPNSKITLVGHSLGGSVAQYVSLKHSTEAYIFNSAPLGAGLQKDIGSAKLKKAKDLIQHLSVDGDWLSNNRWIWYLDRIVSAIGIKTPGSFGNRLSIPSKYADRYKTHGYIMGSISNAMGIDNPLSGEHLKTIIAKRPLVT